MPMLPCHPNTEEGPFDSSFKSVDDFLYFPLLQDQTICGSSLGWLIIFYQTTSDISLMNPLNKTQIHLPKLPVSHSQNENNEPPIVYKAVLSSNPITNPSKYIVLAIYGEKKKLIFCQPYRNSSWITLEETGAYYDDIIPHFGKFYAVNEFGRVVHCNFDYYSHFGSPLIVKEVALPWFFNADKVYIVIIGGNLCLVKRFLQKNRKFGNETYAFEVYMYYPYYEKWFFVPSIGNWTIFLGINQSLAIPSSMINGNVQGDCIYFSDDQLDVKVHGGLGGHDFGVFRLVNYDKQDDTEGTWSLPMYFRDGSPWGIWLLWT